MLGTICATMNTLTYCKISGILVSSLASVIPQPASKKIVGFSQFDSLFLNNEPFTIYLPTSAKSRNFSFPVAMQIGFTHSSS